MQEKLILLSLFVFVAILMLFLNSRAMHSPVYTYLALGDSYTIGESVAVFENFPYQTVQLLRKGGLSFNAPEIVAKKGWTTGDLKKGIRSTLFQPSYQVVSLLIGVNNHYRNMELNEYAAEFEQLVKQAIQLAANKADHVFILSIPDWAATPFGKQKIVEQPVPIEAFNRVNERIARQYSTNYVSTESGEASGDERFLAPDGLHPSGKEYARWATQLADGIFKRML